MTLSFIPVLTIFNYMYYQPLCNNIYKLVNIKKRAPICRSTLWAFITKKNSICSHYRNVNQINGQGAVTENRAGPFFGPYRFWNLSHVRDTVHCHNNWHVFIDLIYLEVVYFAGY